MALKALFALPMDEAEAVLFAQCTGRDTPPIEEADEAAFIVGRRGGKSFIAAIIAVFLALLRDWRAYLGPGERAHVVVIAQNLRAARVVLNYIRGILRGVPAFAREVVAERADEIDLRSGVTVSVWPCTYRATRGLTVVAAVLDEVDFWWQESINAAEEVVAAIRPAMAALPRTKLLPISSPYTPTGWLHQFFRAHWAQPGPYLVWRAPSLLMNPTLNPDRIAAATAEDPERAAAEWQAEWRAGAAALFDDPALLDACVRRDPFAIPPQRGCQYVAGVDPSGGGDDEFSWSIAHREGERIIVDLMAARGRHGRQPLDLEAAVRECAADLHRYGLRVCIGDRYAGAWPVEAFSRHGIFYQHAACTKSEAFLGLLPLVTSGRLEIPEDADLLRQIRLLERRRGAQGKDTVDHPAGGHDDRINSVALAVFSALPSPEPQYGEVHVEILGAEREYLGASRVWLEDI